MFCLGKRGHTKGNNGEHYRSSDNAEQSLTEENGDPVLCTVIEDKCKQIKGKKMKASFSYDATVKILHVGLLPLTHETVMMCRINKELLYSVIEDQDLQFRCLMSRMYDYTKTGKLANGSSGNECKKEKNMFKGEINL